jgi:hypothetical protein
MDPGVRQAAINLVKAKRATEGISRYVPSQKASMLCASKSQKCPASRLVGVSWENRAAAWEAGVEHVSNDVEGAVEAGMFSLSSDLARSVTLRSGKRVGSLSPSKPRPPDGSMEVVDLVRDDEEQASNLLSKAPPASGFSSGSSSVGSPLRRRRVGEKEEMLAVPVEASEEDDDVDKMQVDSKPALLGIDEEEDDDDGHSTAAPSHAQHEASTSTTRLMRTLA